MNDNLLSIQSRRDVLRRILGLAVATTVFPARVALAGPMTRDQLGDQNQTLPRLELPEFAKAGNQRVREAYRFAVAHGKDLDYIPCFCGCRKIGHRHNRDCYIKSENPDRTITYTSHAAT